MAQESGQHGDQHGGHRGGRHGGHDGAQDGTVVARTVSVHGMVQGVGFRFHCLREAQRLGVTGWVRNEPDGTVAGHFEGAAAAVDALVDWCRSGPSHAGVDRVEVSDAVPGGHRGFGVE